MVFIIKSFMVFTGPKGTDSSWNTWNRKCHKLKLSLGIIKVTFLAISTAKQLGNKPSCLSHLLKVAAEECSLQLWLLFPLFILSSKPKECAYIHPLQLNYTRAGHNLLLSTVVPGLILNCCLYCLSRNDLKQVMKRSNTFPNKGYIALFQQCWVTVLP